MTTHYIHIQISYFLILMICHLYNLLVIHEMGIFKINLYNIVIYHNLNNHERMYICNVVLIILYLQLFEDNVNILLHSDELIIFLFYIYYGLNSCIFCLLLFDRLVRDLFILMILSDSLCRISLIICLFIIKILLFLIFYLYLGFYVCFIYFIHYFIDCHKLINSFIIEFVNISISFL